MFARTQHRWSVGFLLKVDRRRRIAGMSDFLFRHSITSLSLSVVKNEIGPSGPDSVSPSGSFAQISNRL